MFDIIIHNALIYDGTGGAPYTADLGILGDRITAIGDLKGKSSTVTINAEGLALLPGFIDSHTHADLDLLRDRQHGYALLQGVTTEIIGPCGLGYFPLSDDNLISYAKYLEGLNGPLPDQIKFNDLSEYLALVDGCGINVAANISHGAVRMHALGFSDAPLKGEALEVAKQSIRTAAEQGAVGFSTGLSYYPASYADDAEVIELASTAGECGLPLASHCRTIFPDPKYNMDSRYEEFIDMARAGGFPLHFSHTKHKPSSAGNFDSFYEPFENAMAKGLDITMEFYPYTFGAGYAIIFLPGWFVCGGYNAALARFDDLDCVARLRTELLPDREKIGIGRIAYAPKHPEYVGKTFAQAADENGCDILDLFIDLMRAEKMVVGYQSNAYWDPELVKEYEKDFVKLMEKPYYMIGSDGEPAHTLPHERLYGTFPKLMRLARENGQNLSAFAACASGRAAKRFGLAKRGFIREGYFADLVLLNPNTVRECSSIMDPKKPPIGIQSVFVNGKLAVKDGSITGSLAGHSLRKGKE